MSVAIVNYLQFRNRETFAAASPLWQNFFVDRSGDFLPFGYNQGAGQTAGDRSQASLVTPVNTISLNYAKEAADNRYIAEVTTREINISSLSEAATISREIWVVGNFRHDQELLTFTLRGPGDATRQGPGRFLSRSLVGSVPSSGTLVIS
jgi:hypothetical protein